MSQQKSDNEDLLVQIIQKETERKQIRRALSRYFRALLIFLSFSIITFISSHYTPDATISGFIGFTSFISGAIFCIIAFYFFAIKWDFIDTPTLSENSIYKQLKRIWKIEDELEILHSIQATLEIKQRPFIETYKSQLPEIIQQYQTGANNNRRISNTIQTLVILFSLLITGLTSGLAGVLNLSNAGWIAPSLSLIVSFLTAITGFFKYRERSFNLQQTADSIEFENNAAELGIFHYKGLDKSKIQVELAERIERLRDEQRKRQQQLEQPSENTTTS